MIWLLLACILAVPVGVRTVLGSVIPGVHEYEALLFYGSDILVLLLIGFVFLYRREALRSLFQERGGVLLVILLIAAGASACVAPSFELGAYSVIRLAVAVAFAYAVGVIASPAKAFRMVLLTIGVIAVLQSVIGITQFARQSDVGLQMFGEPSLAVIGGPSSTINAEGGRVLRAYGTFPHPNILAGFLALGLVSLSFFYLWCESVLKKDIFNHPRSWWNLRHGVAALKLYLKHPYFYFRLLAAAGTFIITVGLVLSLSRSGWLAALIGVITLCAAALNMHIGKGAILRLGLMLLACIFINQMMFSLLITPRAQFARTDPAVNERVIYGNIGIDMMSTMMGGVGAGNQVLYGVSQGIYRDHGLTRAQNWEPIHNLYLLMGAEIGWLGLLSFLIFLGVVTIGRVSRGMWRLGSLEWAVVMAMLSALIVVGLFDHYLWTLQPGRLMLWLVIGLVLSRLTAVRPRS